jgi:hypothetical protein
MAAPLFLREELIVGEGPDDIVAKVLEGRRERLLDQGLELLDEGVEVAVNGVVDDVAEGRVAAEEVFQLQRALADGDAHAKLAEEKMTLAKLVPEEVRLDLHGARGVGHITRHRPVAPDRQQQHAPVDLVQTLDVEMRQQDVQGEAQRLQVDPANRTTASVQITQPSTYITCACA